MGILSIFKKKNQGQVDFAGKTETPKATAKNVLSKKEIAQKAVKAEKILVKPPVIKGKTNQAYRILVKPLITEKATYLNALNKYVFAINRRMNKVEVKKAIRTIYNVEPLKVSIANFSGKQVRLGRQRGQTKDWKKAIITLKPGDKIEIYEGV